VRVVLPMSPPKEAEMVAVPGLRADALPRGLRSTTVELVEAHLV
jgi:hypothetical protein